MNVRDLIRIVPSLLDSQVPGAYDDPVDLGDGLFWIVRVGGTLGAVVVSEQWRPHVRIKAGVALDMPLSYELAYRVANLNREVWTGRLYLRSNPKEGKALVLAEDVVFGAALDEQSPAGLADLSWRIGWLMKFAGALGQDMIGEFGGRTFGTDDALFLDIDDETVNQVAAWLAKERAAESLPREELRPEVRPTEVDPRTGSCSRCGGRSDRQGWCATCGLNVSAPVAAMSSPEAFAARAREVQWLRERGK